MKRRKAKGAPRYLGTVNNLTINNAVVSIATGPQTGQVRARQGDFVLALAAIDDGTLRSAGSVFQWSGTAWQFRSATAHADLYTRCFKDGLNVLANNTEWFGAVIARELIAMKAFIEELSAQIITLKNGGIIQSENFQQGQSGFRIKHDGGVEFNNAIFRGHVEAKSGEMNNVSIKEQAVFLGTVSSGPVFISNETTAPVPPTTFSSGTMIRTIVDTIGRNITINVSSGSYGSKGGLVSLITSYQYLAPTSQNFARTIYKLTIVFNDNTSQEFTADSLSNTLNATINQQLLFGGSLSGKIFRISNLPTGSAGLQAGTVYRNGNYLMIV